MSLQAQLNNIAIENVSDLIDEFVKKGHPHLDQTIVEFFNNYHTPFDNLDENGIIEFKNELEIKLQYLVDANA